MVRFVPALLREERSGVRAPRTHHGSYQSRSGGGYGRKNDSDAFENDVR